VLTIHTLPVPEIDDNEVLIAVHTGGVGSWDAGIRAGWLPDGEQPHFPLVLGTDGSGHVAKVGSRIRRFKVGEEVYAYSFANPKGGFYAEYVAVIAEKVAHTPKGLDLEHAGAIGTTGLTALQGIDDALHVKKGESVIIHGASGGLGTLAIQFAKFHGARVLSTASGDDGVNLVRKLGADVAVDGKREDLTAAARNFAPDGVDAILATVGGNSLEHCIDAAKRGGRVAYPNGVEPVPKKRPGIKFVSYDGTPGVREFEHLNKAIEEAKLQVPIAAAFKLEQAVKAHERLAQGHVLGKIVLRIR
jgi:NADPH:quinone reductase-like Zn-dependent oxidoreductase